MTAKINDQIVFESMDDGFAAVPKIFGGLGQDSITWNADVSVGTANSSQTLELDFEAVLIDGEITLRGGGDIAISAMTQL